MKFETMILAGGEGRRIGGAKPLCMLAGRTLLDRAINQALVWGEQVSVAVRDPDQLQGAAVPMIEDVAHIEGPLGGLLAALRFARERGAEAALTIPADMPFLPADLPDRLSEDIGKAASAIASSGGHLHPVCGLWRVGSLKFASDYLASGKRSLKGFAEAAGFVEVEWPAQPIDPFFNINSAEDLATAELLLGG
jgi:molybdenum cofactor guanylyltransferase